MITYTDFVEFMNNKHKTQTYYKKQMIIKSTTPHNYILYLPYPDTEQYGHVTFPRHLKDKGKEVIYRRIYEQIKASYDGK